MAQRKGKRKINENGRRGMVGKVKGEKIGKGRRDEEL